MAMAKTSAIGYIVDDHAERACASRWSAVPLGETYNIGGRNERANLHVVETICELLDQMAPPSKRDHGVG